jgi:hypothetical protein
MSKFIDFIFSDVDLMELLLKISINRKLFYQLIFFVDLP